MREEIQYRLEVQRNTRTMIIVSILVAAAGILLIYVSELDNPSLVKYKVLQSVFSTLGVLLFGSVAVFVLWELVAKRIFLDEVLSKVGISSNLRSTGLLEILFDSADIKWASLFLDVKEVDLFFSYAKSWRGIHEIKLRSMVSSSHTKLRVVLPNPENKGLMSTIACEYAKTVKSLQSRVREAEKDFAALGDIAKKNGGSVQIYYSDAYPTFSYFRFDSVAVISLYSHARQKTTVPHFIVAEGGTLYDFTRAQFQSLVELGSKQSIEK